MIKIRRIIFFASLILFVVASTISLMFATVATNPTGRWFSSSFVDKNQSGEVFGRQAEIILGYDLNLSQNDSKEGERRCFCSVNYQAPPGRCNVCETTNANISTWSIPDFVTDEMIVDSKAVSQFSTDEQIQNFITVAQQTNRELWIYVRQDTQFSESVHQSILSTGGDIVPYFVVDANWPLLMMEQAANNTIVIVLIIAAGLLVWEYIALQRRNDLPPSDTLPDELERAKDSVEETERYLQRMERLSKKVLKDDDKDK
jgi:hypothetical protein